MTIAQFDIGVRVGTSAIILLLAVLMLTHARRLGPPGFLFAPLGLCLAGFVLGNTPYDALRPSGIIGQFAYLGSGFVVVFLWWFALACFEPRFRLKGEVLAGGALWALVAAADRSLFGERLGQIGLSRVLVLLGFAIIGHLVWRLLSERQDDLIEQRRGARMLVAVLLGGMLFIDLTADALLGFAWQPAAFAMIQNLMILGFAVWLASRLLDVRDDVLSFGVHAIAVSTPSARAADNGPQDAALHRRLRALMEEERVYLDPDLTFARFVGRMGAPERTVRTLINRTMGHDHFRSFLNHYRVGHACRLLDQGDRDTKLIAIAQDSGFASLPSFNRAFRALRGCSPSEYRSAAQRGALPGDKRPEAGF